MAVTPGKLLGVFREELAKVPERAPGYRDALFETISDIIREEQLNQIRSTQIQRKVTDLCEALGEIIVRASTDNRNQE